MHRSHGRGDACGYHRPWAGIAAHARAVSARGSRLATKRSPGILWRRMRFGVRSRPGALMVLISLIARRSRVTVLECRAVLERARATNAHGKELVEETSPVRYLAAIGRGAGDGDRLLLHDFGRSTGLIRSSFGRSFHLCCPAFRDPPPARRRITSSRTIHDNARQELNARPRPVERSQAFFAEMALNAPSRGGVVLKDCRRFAPSRA